MNLNTNQQIAIVLVVLGVLTASTAQLTDLFGPLASKYIVSASGLLVSIFSGILGVITGQGGQLRDVQAMPGVERITVNAAANQTLAAMAVDQSQPKIEIKAGAENTVAATARSTS